ncbi:MAG: hypothetical protein Q8S21_04965 [Candidatus Paracaedibacteraceae bacterium]|nr:hypothetical protein [Candidatus Paracaedibacteraceae bacterium]
MTKIKKDKNKTNKCCYENLNKTNHSAAEKCVNFSANRNEFIKHAMKNTGTNEVFHALGQIGEEYHSTVDSEQYVENTK